jgi:hypothetical protein
MDKAFGRNAFSYRFMINFSKRILAASCAIFILILLTRFDIRFILYLSLLVPLYIVWGFIISRKHLVNKYFPKGSELKWNQLIKDVLWRIFLDAQLVWGLIILFNIILFNLSWHFFLLCAIQLGFIFLLIIEYLKIVQKLHRKENVVKEQLESSEDSGTIRKNYLSSLNLFLLLVSVLPVAGIFIYSFFQRKFNTKRKSK